MILWLIRGVSGAGKSTVASGMPVDVTVAADDYHTDAEGNYNWKPENVKRAHEWCRQKVRQAMRLQQSIVVHNTFTQEWELKPYYEMATLHGYTVYSLIVENRHNGVNVHNVPEETLKKMKDRFEIQL